MNANLSKVASQVLRLFVRICERAIRLQLDRSAKGVLFLKKAFLRTDDFTEFKVRLDKLTKWEQLNAIAGIYKNSAIAADLSVQTYSFLANNKAEQQIKEQEQHDTKELMRTLAFDESRPATWNHYAQAPVETWSQINLKIQRRLVAGTGDWLLEDNLFKTWAKKNGEQPLLAFVGEEGAGKSYLISAAISHLRTSGSLLGHGKEEKSRRLVAYHYIDKNKPNAEHYSLGKSIIWQFAASDASYKQSVAATCRSGNIEPNNILFDLLLNHKNLKNIDAFFYVVINKVGDHNCDVDEVLVRFLQAISRSKSSAVRVLFSATPGTIKNLKTHDVFCPTIMISDKNESDRRKYIGSRMNRMHALSNSIQRKVAEIREEIENSLCEKTKGNYNLIDATLDRLHPLESEGEIRDILKHAERSMSQHIVKDIEMLNDIRTDKELAEINEMILWLISAKERMSPEMMTSVLQAKNKTASLLSLEDRIRDKFILFEINEDGYVDFRAGNVPNIKSRRDLDKERLSDRQALNQGEADMITHFLKSMCPQHILEKIDLNSHLKQKMKVRGEQICRQDEHISNFRIAQTCVNVLANDHDEGLSVLRKYAVTHLGDHMLLTSRELIDRDELTAFGSNLMKLFHDPDAIDNLLLANSPIPQLPVLLRDTKFTDEISEWLEDPIVVSKIDADVDNTPRGVIEPSIRQMAVHCFQRESSLDVTIAAYEGIRDFCGQVSLPNDSLLPRLIISSEDAGSQRCCRAEVIISRRNRKVESGKT